MADISETLLQAAQVINQSYGMLAQAQGQINELEVKRKNYEDMAQAREETLAYREQALQAKQEKDALDTQNKALQTEISLKNSESIRMQAETGVRNATTNEQRAATEDYSAHVRAAATANKISTEDATKLQKELEAAVVGVRTGDPELDKGMIFQTQDELRTAWGRANATVTAGEPLPPEMQRFARLQHIPDQDWALRERTKIEKLQQFRDAFAKEKLIPEHKQQAANFLSSISFLNDMKQTTNTSPQKAYSDQVNQNADNSTRAVIGPTPGTIGSGPEFTPETLQGFDTVDRLTSTDTTKTPDGFNTAKQGLAQILMDRIRAGDVKGAQAIGARTEQKNPGLAQAVHDLVKSLNGSRK